MICVPDIWYICHLLLGTCAALLRTFLPVRVLDVIVSYHPPRTASVGLATLWWSTIPSCDQGDPHFVSGSSLWIFRIRSLGWVLLRAGIKLRDG